MTFSEEEANNPPATTGTTAGATTGTTGTTETTTGAAAGATTGGGGGGFLEELGPSVQAQAHDLREQIWAVQQIYALRNRRLELQPSVGVSLNDPFVSHTGVGLAANFWITNVLAVGLNFIWFQGLNARSEIDFHVARSARLVVPINEYQLAAGLNFTYVPVYGKFLMFNQYIFHWDLYVMAGIGLMRTRPIPVVDPEVRTFQFGERLMFNVGLGVRIFLNRWLGIFTELRNYVYLETLESLTIGQPDRPIAVDENGQPVGEPVMGSRQDRSTWTQSNVLTDNVMIQFGITIFLPPGVTYRLLK